MDFHTEKRAKIQVVNELAEHFPHDLQMYTDPPTRIISLHDFEDLAIERLKILRILEQVNLRVSTKNNEDFRNAVIEELRKQGLKTYQKLITGFGCGETDFDYEARKRDYLSHFILRIAYCQSEEYRKWFITRELELFKMRWMYLTASAKQKFLKLNNFHYSPISEEKCQALNTITSGMIKSNMNEYYQVYWTDVLDLVQHRRVYLENGFAYITSNDLISVLGSVFRTNLSRSLVLMSHKLHVFQQDERVARLVNNLHHTYIGKKYTVNESGQKISLDNLDALCKTSFPLCMKQLHTTLRAEHHLRHFGRQQYSLFLKGIGLSLENALLFWRTEFTKKMDVDRFDKSYAYNIRHNYGKEGKRTNYTPYSCMKIISSSVGPGEQHGCPFKHTDANTLKQILNNNNVPQQDMQDILASVNKGHPQLACVKYFEFAHSTTLGCGTIDHPNQYFEESQKLLSMGKQPEPSTNVTSINKNAVLQKDELNDSELASIDLDNL